MLNRLIPVIIIIGQVALSPAITFPQQKATKDEGATSKQESKLTEDQEQGLNMVRQVAASAGAFRDRLRGSLIEAQAADLLWPFDEIQARLHFQQAFEVAGKVKPERNAPESEGKKFLYKVQQTKREILKLLSRHDSEGAEELAKRVKIDEKETAEASPKGREGKEAAESSEGQAEMAESLVQLGREAVRSDPKKALEFGLKSIKGGQFAQLFGILLAELYDRAPEAGRQLLFAGVDQLTKPGSDVLSGLIQMSPLSVAPQRWEREPAFREAALRLLEILSQTLTETVLIIRQGQFLSTEIARGLTRLAQERFIPALQVIDPPRLPEMQQLLSELSTQLDARYRKLSAVSPLVAGRYENFDSELVKAEAERDTAVRDIYFQALTAGALKRRDYQNARRAAEKIQEVELRIETLDNINLGQATNEVENQNFGEAVRLARDINDMLLRTRVLIWVATHAAKDEALIRQVLDQAYLSAQQAENGPDKGQALVKLADTYAQYDVPRAFEIYFAAAQVLNKLGSSQPAKEGQPRKRLAVISFAVGSDEDSLAKERVALEDISFGRGLERLGQEDYQQAMLLLANSVKHEILRARMQLAVCRGVLNKKPTDKEIQK